MAKLGSLYVLPWCLYIGVGLLLPAVTCAFLNDTGNISSTLAQGKDVIGNISTTLPQRKEGLKSTTKVDSPKEVPEKIEDKPLSSPAITLPDTKEPEVTYKLQNRSLTTSTMKTEAAKEVQVTVSRHVEREPSAVDKWGRPLPSGGRGTWLEATQTCRTSHNVSLPALRSPSDFPRLVAAMTAGGWQEAWLAHRRVGVSKLRWVDGSQAGPTTERPGRGFQCGILNMKTRRVQYERCDRRPRLLGYICQVPPTKNADQCVCPEQSHDVSCVTSTAGDCLVELCCNKTWFEARRRCQDFGGDLVMLKNDATTEAIEAHHHLMKYWIGLSNAEWSPAFDWTDVASKWFPGHPSGYQCVLLSRRGTSYLLKAAPCHQTNNFSCVVGPVSHDPAANTQDRDGPSTKFTLSFIIVSFLMIIIVGLVCGLNCPQLERWWMESSEPSRKNPDDTPQEMSDLSNCKTVEKAPLLSTERNAELRGIPEEKQETSGSKDNESKLFPSYVVSKTNAPENTVKPNE